MRPAFLGSALLAVLLVSTAGHGGTDPWLLLIWHGILLAAVLAAWWFPVGAGVGRRPAAGVSLALCGFALLVALGLPLAPYTYAAWLAALELAAFLAAFALAVRCSTWLGGPLGILLVSGGMLQTVLLLIQRYVWEDPRPAGTFLNPNYLAAWLMAAILYCGGRALVHRGDPFARRLGWFVLPLGFGMVLTGSRGAWIGLFAGAGWLMLRSVPTLGRRGRHRLVAGALLFVLIGLVAVAVRMRKSEPFRYQRHSSWRASVTSLLEAPWTGTGPGQFSRASRNLQFPDGHGPLRYDRGFSTTHSDWLRAAVELGWPGLAVLIWIALSTSSHAVRRRRAGNPSDAGALAGLTGLFVHAAFDNISRSPGVYLIAAVLLGLVVAIDGPARRSVARGWRIFVALFLVLFFVLGDYAPWRAYRAGSVGALDAAVGWNPADAVLAIERAESIVSGGPLDWERYRAARGAAERAVRLCPADGDLLRRAARIEAESLRSLFPDRTNRARVAALYRRAARLQRTNPFVQLELAAFLLDFGDPAGARRAAQRALEIEPEAVAPRLLLAHAFAALDEVDRAEELLETAVRKIATHAATAGSGAYARDLLAPDAATLTRVRRIVASARQSAGADARFESGGQEDETGDGRSID